MHLTVRPSAAFSAALALVALGFLSSCGGGSSSGTPQADFSLSVSPITFNLPQGTSTTITVTASGVNGFNSSIAVSFSLPATVSAAPATFSLTSGGSQTVTISQSGTVSQSSAAITVNGTAGALSHTAMTTLQLLPGTADFRMRYFETGSPLSSFLYSKSVIYHFPTKRFFATDFQQNRIYVYDAATAQQVNYITVPEVLTLDQSSDQSTLYAGTVLGDFYMIDPVGMVITKRIPSGQIGSGGYPAMIVQALADGTVALMGASNPYYPVPSYGVIFAVGPTDGFTDFAIWNPSSNNLTTYPSTSACGNFAAFYNLIVTPDKSKVWLRGYQGGQGYVFAACLLDPKTAQYKITTAAGPGLQPPDGQEFLTIDAQNVNVFSTATLQMQDQFPFPSSQVSGAAQCILSTDGAILYCAPSGTGTILAVNWKTHALVGWSSSPEVSVSSSMQLSADLLPQAISENGLIAGFLGHGVGLANAGNLQTGTPQTFNLANVSPNVGAASGGTQVQFSGWTAPEMPLEMFFGTKAGGPLSLDGSLASAVSPPQTAGPVDMFLQFTGGGVLPSFAGFSYGPNIKQVITNASTAEGGGIGIIYGYGLSAQTAPVPTDLEITIGGQSAPVTAFQPQFTYSDGGVSNLQRVEFTIPPGIGGTSADIVITNASGSTTASKAFTYLPGIQSFPLPGAQLGSGIYDPVRDVYYFLDQTNIQIQIFSRSNGSWRTPISLPTLSGATSQQLYYVALSPNGSTLAVSTFNGSLPQSTSGYAADAVYVVDLANAPSVKTFSVPYPPGSLAITDQGVVYVACQYSGIGVYNNYIYKVDTLSGTVTQLPGISANQFLETRTADYRVLLTPDNQHLFIQQAGWLLQELDTASDTVHVVSADGTVPQLDMSANGVLSAGRTFLDSNLNITAAFTIYELQTYPYLWINVVGGMLSADGSLLFLRGQSWIDVFSGTSGDFLGRIALPFQVSLVKDGYDNVFVSPSGTGAGAAVIDLSAVTPQFFQHSILKPGAPANKLLTTGMKENRLAAPELSRKAIPATPANHLKESATRKIE